MEHTVDSSNLAYLEALYQQYQENPSSVPPEWSRYFQNLQAEPTGGNGAVVRRQPSEAELSEMASFFLRAVRFLRTYRERGHLIARIDPLGRERRTPPELDPSYFGLSEADLDRPVPPELGAPTLRAVLEQYKTRYSGTVGIEYGHLDDPTVRNWIEARLAAGFTKPTPEQKRRIQERLMQATLFEEFLQKKYLGAKTFSLEGTESLIPLLDLVLEAAARQGVVEVVMGMAHRGRLNVLANVVRKPLRDIFLEFEEHFPEGYHGDVKYHLGYSNDIETPFGKVHLSLNFNPSHLEFVAPVAMGRTRAKQDRFGDARREKGMLLLVHGDAAFIGEGIVQETLNISGLPAYTVGGALHIILNNQVGFTTEPHEYTSGRYATEIAKMVESPIFHVNAEDPEALVGVVELAMEFRRTFKRDVFIDLVGYRKRGHNETDEPSFTQPDMYRRIAAKKPLYQVYQAKLEAEGVCTKEGCEGLAKQYQETLEAAFSGARREPTPTRPPAGGGVWKGYLGGPEEGVPDPETGVPLEKLSALMEALTRLPEGFSLHPRLGKFLEARREMGQNKRPLDWAAAEMLAFASLAVEGHRVRLSGQDTVRGTFTQRHGAFTDYRTGERYIPANHLAEGQAPVELYNSALSEAGVLGFEYGYSLDMPDALVGWEAQYGDFVNTAQVIIDQFIASAEAKWSRLSGIVLLLPHGMEGGGPEHSSARLERFLQLCSNDNIQVAYPTTPAQYFHLLRRQVKRPWRKPLIVMTPKSLLRNPDAVSPLEDLTKGRFQRVLVGPPVPGASRILLCSGKVYYDLEAARRASGRGDVALIRLEQLYPFPQKELEAALASYPAGVEVVWVQEEPANMGAWWFIRARFGDRIFGRPLRVVARPESSSPAVGSKKVHDKEQQALVRQALGL
ncbi:MAG: 2-oxoglutarate dehydrogenase E1 component [Meiothermus sp.]|uniref:2-oxoglutarate dehydrogenase E1 component n=1 Tax=Meiothermus sp. TaxID=1955249 RepID=UPI0025F4C33D|nr:2-oxoglutarate dehydrogenase E1 component [Meiothermus sp.]MCS7058535.1 2-oxoglutarate dehydrogenase E1 component [Meiothermus sp.]MCS7195439.1 2-oxoglutarate dehydrogenase E1 component [Meiothermus sp.]MDW8091066.1 2-oxoglutarate dehydrogenase E1 component [Meiothermus sp.]MDW8480955.1 2-oxoglutarate dehydrogenase E1 component [Meiothermus sp.]